MCMRKDKSQMLRPSPIDMILRPKDIRAEYLGPVYVIPSRSARGGPSQMRLTLHLLYIALYSQITLSPSLWPSVLDLCYGPIRTNSRLQSTGGRMNLDEEVRLYTTAAERERTENLATLYSIIVSLEYLERAYVRDSVTGKE